MTDAGSFAGAANTAIGQAIGLATRQLEPRVRERIRRSFETASEWCLLTDEEQQAQSKGGARKVGRGLRKAVSLPGRGLKLAGGKLSKRQENEREPIGEGHGDRQAIQAAAKDLTRAWTEELTEIAADSSNRGETWISVLEACLERTATKCSSSDQENHREWRYVVAGNSGKQPDESKIKRWAGAMTRQLIEYWNSDRHLAPLVAQLNLESGLGLQMALVTAGREISNSLWWIALAVTVMTLVGGGGIALLVLLVDKG